MLSRNKIKLFRDFKLSFLHCQIFNLGLQPIHIEGSGFEDGSCKFYI